MCASERRNRPIDHPFCTYTIFPEKLRFTPSNAHIRLCYQGLRNVSFSENSVDVLNGLLPKVNTRKFGIKR